MEMTRRGFVAWLLAVGAGVAAGAKRLSPRRFVVALRAKVYPGPMRHIGDISKQGKWSG